MAIKTAPKLGSSATPKLDAGVAPKPGSGPASKLGSALGGSLASAPEAKLISGAHTVRVDAPHGLCARSTPGVCRRASSRLARPVRYGPGCVRSRCVWDAPHRWGRKTAHYMLRWVATMGEKRPWSETDSATTGRSWRMARMRVARSTACVFVLAANYGKNR